MGLEFRIEEPKAQITQVRALDIEKERQLALMKMRKEEEHA